MIYILLFLIVMVAALLFVPQLASWRTAIFNGALMIIGAVVPVASDVFGFLEGLNWQTYITDKYVLLAVIAGVSIVGIILRHITTGPAAWRKDIE